MLNIKKDLATLMELSSQRADTVTLPGGTTMSLTPGSVARLLIACVNAEFEMAYEKLEEVHLQSFLSTATGQFIDLIGELVSCKRYLNESDDNYKYRVSKQVTVLEAANQLAIKMSLLSIDNVSDVVFQRFTYGCGSFTAFVITDNAMDQADVIEKCEEVVSQTVAYGTKFSIEIPTLIPVEIGIKVIFKNTATDTANAKLALRAVIREYINSRAVGESIIINEIIEKAMSISDDIYDINIFKFKIDNKNVEAVNQSCRTDERFIESSVPNAIYIA